MHVTTAPVHKLIVNVPRMRACSHPIGYASGLQWQLQELEMAIAGAEPGHYELYSRNHEGTYSSGTYSPGKVQISGLLRSFVMQFWGIAAARDGQRTVKVSYSFAVSGSASHTYIVLSRLPPHRPALPLQRCVPRCATLLGMRLARSTIKHPFNGSVFVC